MTPQSEFPPTVLKTLLVQHNYHDHSNDLPYYVLLDDNISDPDAILSNDSYKLQAATGGRIPFPMKLHEMLNKTEEDGLAGIVSWKPHGRAFIICNAKKFAEKVLPRCFGKTKFLSFQRQLNIYDFTRISAGPDEGAYYHEMFLRGKVFLADCITRRTVKGTKTKASVSPNKEPNFYTMSYVGVASTALTAPVALQPFLDERPVLSSIISQRFDEPIRLMDPSKLPNIERRDTRTAMIPLFNDLEWMPLLLKIDEIDTTSPTDGVSVDSFTGTNAHEINTMGPSNTFTTKGRVDSSTGTCTSPDEAVHFPRINVHGIETKGLFDRVSAKEGELDSFTGTYDALEDVEWTSLQDLSLGLGERNQLFCLHNCTEEEFGEQESVAKELKSVTDWVRDFFEEPQLDLLHTRDIRMAPSHQAQKQNKRSDSNWFAMPNIGKQSAQSKGSDIAYSSSNLPTTVWRTGEPWNGKLQPEQSILPDVEKPSAPMAHDDFINRLFTLAMRMEQSELSRCNADQLLKASPRCHSLDSALQHSRSNLRQMIKDILKSFLHNCELSTA